MKETAMMNVKELIPWHWGKREVPVRREDADPVGALQWDINRAFETFWRGFDLPLPGASGIGAAKNSSPKVDIGETDKEVEIKTELPGMEPADIEVSLADGAVTIRGEKRSERKAEEKDYVLRERSFGAIERTVPLPEGLDLDATVATFKNGVLTLSIPKTSEARAAVKRIRVRHA
jgi:HSP20 family protein